MNKKLLVTAIFAIAAAVSLAGVTAPMANTISQNIVTESNTAAAANTINAAAVAASPVNTVPDFTGNVSVMGGVKPDQGGSPAFDNPNALNLNYKTGNWTWSLNGATDFTGKINSAYANTAGAGNQNVMLNTWGMTGAYNFQNGLTTSLNVSYLNWRSQSNGQYTTTTGTYNISPVLVTGYQIAPNLTYINGANTYGLALTFQVIGSANGQTAINQSSGYNTAGANWNGANGEYFSAFPMYTRQVNSQFTLGTGVQLQQANDNYIILSNAVNNETNNDIIIHPAMLSYNVASIPGLNLNFDTRYYIFNTISNDSIQTTQATPGAQKLCFYPGIAYTMNITHCLTWTTNAQVYAKYYTNSLGTSMIQNHAGNSSTNYGGQIYTGFNYAF
ncbi:MAG: hypothetical protein NTX05_06745 [Fusobacteria bacterium]|nr:hypothetical protein [Fusobacteriota bacterium]